MAESLSSASLYRTHASRSTATTNALYPRGSTFFLVVLSDELSDLLDAVMYP